MEATMEARRRKKEEITGLKTPGALSEGARGLCSQSGGEARGLRRVPQAGPRRP